MKWLLASALLIAAPAGAEEGKSLPADRARMLPVSSAAAAEAMGAVLKEFGFRLRIDQPKDGLFITRPAGCRDLRRHGLTVSPVRDTPAFEVEIHAFVSRSVEPAHVHVDGIVTSSMRGDGRNSRGYSLGEVEKQVLDALEKRLNVNARAIPDDLEARKLLAASLLGAGEAPQCTSGAMQIPSLIPGSKVRPMFPAEPLLAHESGRVMVLARILSDGSTVPVRILSGTETTHSAEMETACLAVVGLWRYHPARNGTCPLDIPMMVSVDFKQ